MNKKTKKIVTISIIAVAVAAVSVLAYFFCPVYIPDIMITSATVQTEFGCEELSASELQEVKSILGNKWYIPWGDSTGGIPMYGYPENISIKSGFFEFVPAGGGADYVKLGNKYAELSGIEQGNLELIFANHGQYIIF